MRRAGNETEYSPVFGLSAATKAAAAEVVRLRDGCFRAGCRLWEGCGNKGVEEEDPDAKGWTEGRMRKARMTLILRLGRRNMLGGILCR